MRRMATFFRLSAMTVVAFAQTHACDMCLLLCHFPVLITPRPSRISRQHSGARFSQFFDNDNKTDWRSIVRVAAGDRSNGHMANVCGMFRAQVWDVCVKRAPKEYFSHYYSSFGPFVHSISMISSSLFVLLWKHKQFMRKQDINCQIVVKLSTIPHFPISAVSYHDLL